MPQLSATNSVSFPLKLLLHDNTSNRALKLIEVVWSITAISPVHIYSDLFFSFISKICQVILRPLKKNLKFYLNSILTKLVIWKSFEHIEKYYREKGNVSLLYVAYTVLLCPAFAISLAVGLSPLYPAF